MRISKIELILLQLEGQLPAHPRLDHMRQMDREQCINCLREYTGMDFGDDVAKWREWEKRRAEERQAVIKAELAKGTPDKDIFAMLDKMEALRRAGST
jgi:hypothetical protein